MSPPRILLSGRPGCGKTTVIKRSLKLIGQERCTGFDTEEVREGGRRIGFDVVTLDGRRGPLARIGVVGPRLGRYAVDLDSFERLALSSFGPSGGERPLQSVFVLDEIGKMELLSPKFVTLLGRMFADTRRPILGTVLAARHPAVAPIRRRRDIEIIHVTQENRDELPAAIGRVFVEHLSDPDAAAQP
jgi:nucleoside-triphosphatase